MQYTDKLGTITRVGPKKTEFPNGSKVTIGGRDGKPSFPGVSVSVQFDFEPNVWYSGILFEKQAESLAEGKQVNVKVWDKESNGKVYKNFAINSPKKADTAELEKKIGELTTTVGRHTLQINTMYADIVKLKDYMLKKQTTTAFDEGFKDVYPEEHNALYGAKPLGNPVVEYNSIEAFSQATGFETVDDNDVPDFTDADLDGIGF